MTFIPLESENEYQELSYALKLSVVFYDALAEEERVLKKADNTKNFSLVSFFQDWGKIKILETSVKSSKDWGNEKKIKEREIAIDVPNAG